MYKIAYQSSHQYTFIHLIMTLNLPIFQPYLYANNIKQELTRRCDSERGLFTTTSYI